jgi:hypothetical protein
MAELNSPKNTPPPGTINTYGGMPEQTQGFTVQEKEDSPRPDSNSSWNSNMGNPVGPK